MERFCYDDDDGGGGAAAANDDVWMTIMRNFTS